MYCIRADRLGSLCTCKSVDPGSRGAMHARVETPSKASYRAYRLFACVHWVVEAALPTGAAFLTVPHAEGK